MALIKTKTFWTGAASVCYGIGSYVAGEASLPEAFNPVAIGLLGIFLRHGVQKATPVIADLAALDTTTPQVGGPMVNIVAGLEAIAEQAKAQALANMAQVVQAGLQTATSIIPQPPQEVQK